MFAWSWNTLRTKCYWIYSISDKSIYVIDLNLICYRICSIFIDFYRIFKKKKIHILLSKMLCIQWFESTESVLVPHTQYNQALRASTGPVLAPYRCPVLGLRQSLLDQHWLILNFHLWCSVDLIILVYRIMHCYSFRLAIDVNNIEIECWCWWLALWSKINKKNSRYIN